MRTWIKIEKVYTVQYSRSGYIEVHLIVMDYKFSGEKKLYFMYIAYCTEGGRVTCFLWALSLLYCTVHSKCEPLSCVKFLPWHKLYQTLTTTCCLGVHEKSQTTTTTCCLGAHEKNQTTTPTCCLGAHEKNQTTTTTCCLAGYDYRYVRAQSQREL